MAREGEVISYQFSGQIVLTNSGWSTPAAMNRGESPATYVGQPVKFRRSVLCRERRRRMSICGTSSPPPPNFRLSANGVRDAMAVNFFEASQGATKKLTALFLHKKSAQ